MRRAVLEAAGHLDLRTAEIDMLPADLIEADEIFTTNALFGIWPVARLDGHRLSAGPTTRALMTKLGTRVRKRIWIASLGTCLAAIAAGLATLFAWNALHRPLPLPADGAWLEVPSGTPLTRVSQGLGQRQLLPQPSLLTLYARWTGDATRVRAGEYQLLPGTTPLSLLAKLVSGQVYLHQLTIVEGWRFTDLLAAVRANPAVTAGPLDGDEIMTALGEPGVHPEGQFFPDTYYFPRGTSDVEVLRTAHVALREQLEKAWEGRSPDVQLQDPYQALILASIIEKETALPSERRLISGVFHQRLRRNMRLANRPHRHLRPRRGVRRESAAPGSCARHALQHLHALRLATDADRIAGRGLDRSCRDPAAVTDAIYFVATGPR